MGKFAGVVLLGLAVMLFAGCVSVVVVPPDHSAVVFNTLTGELETPRGPGSYWINSLTQSLTLYPLGPQWVTASGYDGVPSLTQDGYEVMLGVALQYRIDPAKVNQIHIHWQTDYEANFIYPTVGGVTREIATGYRANMLYYRPGQLEAEARIKEQLAERLSEEGFILDDFWLREITFSQLFTETQNLTATPEPINLTLPPSVATFDAQIQTTAQAEATAMANFLATNDAAIMMTSTAAVATRQAEIDAGIATLAFYEMGVVVRRETGEVLRVLQPVGYYTFDPATEQVFVYPISLVYTVSGVTETGQPETYSAVEATTQDGESIRLDITVVFAINPSQIERVHQNWQGRFPEGFDAEFLDPVLREVAAQVAAQFSARDLYGQRRLEMEPLIQANLGKRLSEQGFILDDVLVRDIQFEFAFRATVESEQVQAQNATLTAQAQLTTTPSP